MAGTAVVILLSTTALAESPARTAANGLPDPNNPNSPDIVTIEDNGIPLDYVRVPAPETTIVENGGTPLSDTPGYVYIPAEEAPLAEVPINREVMSPQTGAAGVGIFVPFAVLAGTGAAALIKKASAC